jgi:uncharacterized membrane protein
MKRLRRYLVAGLLVWIPLGITLLLLSFFVRLLDRTLALVPSQYKPEALLGFPLPGLGVLLTFLILLVTGVLAANIVGRRFMLAWESFLQRIPFVRAIYAAAKNFAEVVFSESGESFKDVLLIEYPRKGLYSLAFQTATELGEVQGRTGEEVVCCFVPTTPNPTSGYIVIVPKKDVTVMDMSVDEALRMIISLGVVVPRWKGHQPAQLPLA